jgi:uncharacterized coiled-coil protein SlyX
MVNRSDSIARERYLTPSERIDEQRKRELDIENIMTEQEAMQQEIITRLPGPVAFLLNYEFKPMMKIIGIGVLVIIMYLLLGIDVVISSILIFGVVIMLVYWLQMKNQRQDFTRFFEVKKAGQVIETGDHSPYKNSFVVQTDRVSMWMVPNHLIRRGLFKLPAGHELSPLPAPEDIVFVDLFDEYNRTCVLPRSPDTANISFMTNMNPSLSKKFDSIADNISHSEAVEREAMILYESGQISIDQLRKLLKVSHLERLNALKDPIANKRDVVEDLQKIIPEYQEKIRYLQDNLYLLADEMATAGIYQLLKIPMPDKIRDDHNLIRTIYGLPKIKGPKKVISGRNAQR